LSVLQFVFRSVIWTLYWDGLMVRFQPFFVSNLWATHLHLDGLTVHRVLLMTLSANDQRVNHSWPNYKKYNDPINQRNHKIKFVSSSMKLQWKQIFFTSLKNKDIYYYFISHLYDRLSVKSWSWVFQFSIKLS